MDCSGHSEHTDRSLATTGRDPQTGSLWHGSGQDSASASGTASPVGVVLADREGEEVNRAAEGVYQDPLQSSPARRCRSGGNEDFAATVKRLKQGRNMTSAEAEREQAVRGRSKERATPEQGESDPGEISLMGFGGVGHWKESESNSQSHGQGQIHSQMHTQHIHPQSHLQKSAQHIHLSKRR
ncbi:hypothetical protein FT663_04272 [Candidozyma haemuli var. vulneris]|uniref:Uncharacterized protein n=1 Tax=Candidozyma haemuli TaxID=45357 RepID=A0A2V1APJ9_9ASCO|nr:hypothetical protein CXQ85_003636 [[Candida] haemuloni]KAF3986770.1 hypothetical protein FT662_04380 [[Candida] haemuloni var. vulneris]KAF3987879.1 hypothetical protein FT663_04272 [[Candida] haemuloni var. vulneris]PVH19778.1 hypothetical protein CXQ85_003636 [[Candida] haemuloni]